MSRPDEVYFNAATALKELDPMSRWWLIRWLKPTHRRAIKRMFSVPNVPHIEQKPAVVLASSMSKGREIDSSAMTPDTADVIRSLQHKLEKNCDH